MEWAELRDRLALPEMDPTSIIKECSNDPEKMEYVSRHIWSLFPDHIGIFEMMHLNTLIGFISRDPQEFLMHIVDDLDLTPRRWLYVHDATMAPTVYELGIARAINRWFFESRNSLISLMPGADDLVRSVIFQSENLEHAIDLMDSRMREWIQGTGKDPGDLTDRCTMEVFVMICRHLDVPSRGRGDTWEWMRHTIEYIIEEWQPNKNGQAIELQDIQSMIYEEIRHCI